MVLVAPALAEERLGRSGCDVNVLPYHRFEITSALKRHEALAALAAHVEPERAFRARWPNSANDRRFEGIVRDDGFIVRRVLGYNNPFAPQSAASIDGAGVGSEIKVVMQPSGLVIVFAVALLLLGVGGIIMGTGSPVMGAPLVVMLYLGMMIGFWMEAPKQERVLREIFKAL
jgi:hypothetical protein